MMQVFGGVTRSRVTCLACGTVSDKLDPFCDLSLDLHGCTSISDALHTFTATDRLEGSNLYSCEACKRCAAHPAACNSGQDSAGRFCMQLPFHVIRVRARIPHGQASPSLSGPGIMVMRALRDLSCSNSVSDTTMHCMVIKVAALPA